ncbi:cyanophycinase [Shewanella litorisediminis]|uniref:Cyanophycinase n=1 Tax=Shewanella litorisediminis TaxID=1173586 RepID=A0ABX7G039_9GAMM|nr:cyanophycinase [Shewanella litorisediminis]MCL2918266.1 cyanophycinase [Shewanella litorisediminis]QRH00685.1 cyanophycinase [Shewanella litorisediminis]
MTPKFRLFIGAVALSVSIAPVAVSAAAKPYFSGQAQVSDKTPELSLMLAGGALSVCSSMSPKHCTAATHFPDNAKTHQMYELSKHSLARFQTTPAWARLDVETQRALLGSLGSSDSKILDVDGLHELLGPLTNELNDASYFALLDTLEQVQLTPQGEPKTEQVQLAQGKNAQGANHFNAFVRRAARLAGNQPPKIGIVTASARDPFEAASFYQQTFTQAGAIAQWIPLNGALQQAWQFEDKVAGCAALAQLGEAHHGYHDRLRVHPQLWEQHHLLCRHPEQLLNTLASLDGLFLSGGDQSLTLAAWLDADGQPSAALKLVKQRVANGELIIGGTSAGTAVMASGAMITGGTSQGALDFGVITAPPVSERCEERSCEAPFPAQTLTYRTGGGLGFYPFGVTDTHFSERDRQIRLVLLQDKSDTGLAVGVDENTALWLSKDGSFGVIEGEGGVWFSEPAGEMVPENALASEKALTSVQTSETTKAQSHERATHSHIIHYLPHGTRLRLNRDGVTVDDTGAGLQQVNCDGFTPNWLANRPLKLIFKPESRCYPEGYYEYLRLEHSSGLSSDKVSHH